MPKLELPDDFHQLLRDLKENEEREHRKAQRRRRERAVRKSQELAERERASARAHIVFNWARDLAATGALDDLSRGVRLYTQRGYAGRPLPLNAHHDGLYFRGCHLANPAQLVERMRPAAVEELADLIESGAIWSRIRELNRAAQSHPEPLQTDQTTGWRPADESSRASIAAGWSDDRDEAPDRSGQ